MKAAEGRRTVRTEDKIPYRLTAIPSGSLVTFGGTVFYEEILKYGTYGDFYVIEDKGSYEDYEFPPRSPWMNGKTERAKRILGRSV